MLSNRVILITGVANTKSIAWNKALQEKAKVVITYQKEEFKTKINKLIDVECSEDNNIDSICCDISKIDDMKQLQSFLLNKYKHIDSLFHSIAFAPSSALKNPLIQLTNDDFNTTMSISAYSLISLTNTLLPLFVNKASIVALSFLASERYFPNYGVMSIAKAALESTAIQLAGSLGDSGIRVNILRSSPINTLAARGIPQFINMKTDFINKECCKQENPLQDTCNTAAWLLSDYSQGITGQIINVDGGYSIMGM